METPPPDDKRCPHAGRTIRHLLLVALVAVATYLALDGVAESRAVYACDVPESDDDDDAAAAGPPLLRMCSSPDDVTSCLGLYDGDGAPLSCAVSSCGFKLLPHVDVSVIGLSDPLDPDGATSTTSFPSIASCRTSAYCTSRPSWRRRTSRT
jgi:hypothetical protein